jgi:hypothetical protein
MRRSKLRSFRPVRLGVLGLGGLCRPGLVGGGHGLVGCGLVGCCCVGRLGFCLGSFFGSFLEGLVDIGGD